MTLHLAYFLDLKGKGNLNPIASFKMTDKKRKNNHSGELKGGKLFNKRVPINWLLTVAFLILIYTLFSASLKKNFYKKYASVFSVVT